MVSIAENAEKSRTASGLPSLPFPYLFSAFSAISAVKFSFLDFEKRLD